MKIMWEERNFWKDRYVYFIDSGENFTDVYLSLNSLDRKHYIYTAFCKSIISQQIGFYKERRKRYKQVIEREKKKIFTFTKEKAKTNILVLSYMNFMINEVIYLQSSVL